MRASVLIPALNDSLSGRISIINPQADRLSKTYTVKIQLVNPQQKLLPGMIANVRIDMPNVSTALVIPATSVVRDADGLTYVYAVNTQKKAIRKRITVGSLTGDREVIVKEGLQEGDTIVTEGQTNLIDGMSVSL
jgi:RND family efflux transporter MFP subunit